MVYSASAVMAAHNLENPAYFFVRQIIYAVVGLTGMLVASRIIAQGGIAYFTLTAAPLDGVMTIFGSKFFAGVGLLMAGVFQKALFLDLREALMPSLVHANRITEKIGRKRLVAAAVGLALLLGVVQIGRASCRESV